MINVKKTKQEIKELNTDIKFDDPDESLENDNILLDSPVPVVNNLNATTTAVYN